MLWLCFILPSCLLAITRNTSVTHEKAKFVCFIYMQPQKVKFKFVQINMKQVSYEIGLSKCRRVKPNMIWILLNVVELTNMIQVFLNTVEISQCDLGLSKWSAVAQW